LYNPGSVAAAADMLVLKLVLKSDFSKESFMYVHRLVYYYINVYIVWDSKNVRSFLPKWFIVKAWWWPHRVETCSQSITYNKTSCIGRELSIYIIPTHTHTHTHRDDFYQIYGLHLWVLCGSPKQSDYVSI